MSTIQAQTVWYQYHQYHDGATYDRLFVRYWIWRRIEFIYPNTPEWVWIIILSWIKPHHRLRNEWIPKHTLVTCHYKAKKQSLRVSLFFFHFSFGEYQVWAISVRTEKLFLKEEAEEFVLSVEMYRSILLVLDFIAQCHYIFVLCRITKFCIFRLLCMRLLVHLTP